MSQDLDLDPSDPLNLLLHNRSQHDAPTDTDTDSAATPPDWSSLNGMWTTPEDHVKMDATFDVDFGGLLDISFDPNVGIEPASLNYQYTAEFPQFSFGSPHLSSAASSESGSTTGSFSPHVAYSPPSSDFNDEDPATELASRVRKSAGIMLAVQLNDHHQPHIPIQHPQAQGHPSPVFTTVPVSAPILAAAPTAAQTTTSRPKTSHTTIERRYRTNLNARIQSLRAAVPALRVVDRAAAIKAGEALTVEDGEDIVDARGYVDGVKVARKCSKANVLGKAVEYIRVLKNREHRLSRELAGLKTLLGGLVGGNELLREWEREWTARFGGPETDEVGENIPIDEEADDEEEESDDDGSGRKRKKPKVSIETKPKAERKQVTPVVEGEKKKRGRPRKIVPPPSIEPSPALSTSLPLKQEPHRQYLLGVFALFSFFANANVSAPPSPHNHTHQGHVLNQLPPPSQTFGLLQLFHLLVSIVVLASILIPLSRSAYLRLRLRSANTVIVPVTEKAPPSPAPSDETDTDEAGTELSLSSMSGDETVLAPSGIALDAEACILDRSTPLTTRIRTAIRLYSSSTHSSNRRLLALLLHPVPVIGKLFSQSLWDHNIGLAVDEAVQRVNATRPTSGVIRSLEQSLAVDQLRFLSAQLFVDEVLGNISADSDQQQQMLDSVQALGGPVARLAARVGRVIGGGSPLFSPNNDESEHEVEKLLEATVLYRRLSSGESFGTSDAFLLRQLLGSSDVFERGEVEEARDRIIDLITDQQYIK
ncbi:BHLH domain-containing protein [Mycena indigotica]|uniref:BHLH domain-containing protein n=1 Tax=Mycena indigotica TaxID=2126181 RepID=A0A8H6VXK1_9AGAR|nr:BHLH domain-containing protein [Mycena indigotica]KAF7291849.1 BHLH domain-containing protein [Mycena indigotica]